MNLKKIIVLSVIILLSRCPVSFAAGGIGGEGGVGTVRRTTADTGTQDNYTTSKPKPAAAQSKADAGPPSLQGYGNGGNTSGIAGASTTTYETRTGTSTTTGNDATGANRTSNCPNDAPDCIGSSK